MTIGAGVKVKICGITNAGDARDAGDAGCDALGFVFYKKSPRYIAPAKAREIIRGLPRGIIKIGVFADTPAKRIKEIAGLCRLDILQFHGNESWQFCRKFKNYKIIKAFRIKDSIDLERISRYKVFAYLFDAFVKSRLGGTGKSFDWRLLRHIRGIKEPVFLSGGLNAQNVKKAITLAHPEWVDVSSSVEARPGKKDCARVKKFIAAAKNA